VVALDIDAEKMLQLHGVVNSGSTKLELPCTVPKSGEEEYTIGEPTSITT
jgi:hypothetical protein